MCHQDTIACSTEDMPHAVDPLKPIPRQSYGTGAAPYIYCSCTCHRRVLYYPRTNEIRSAIPSLWEAAALGDVEHVSRACLESSRSSKDTTGKSWACPGVNHKTPGLGFTPLHACMAGLAAATRGVDVCRPCTPPRPRGQRNIPSRPSLYACLAREHGRPTGSRGDKSNKNNGTGSPGSIGNYVRVCRTLLSAAADVEALDVRRRTPLALGAAAGSLEVSRATKQRGTSKLLCVSHKDFDRRSMATPCLISLQPVE